jgi:ATP-dependent Zn protease
VSLLVAYHEAGHALVALDFKRRVDSVSLVPGGGRMRQEPLAPDATGEEIERALVVIFAGAEAERYAPPKSWERNGGDPWLTDGELAMLARPETDEARSDDEKRPSDEDVIAHYTERIGSEAIERAREFAREYVERLHVVGRLKRLADELLFRGHLTGDDVERLMAR